MLWVSALAIAVIRLDFLPFASAVFLYDAAGNWPLPAWLKNGDHAGRASWCVALMGALLLWRASRPLSISKRTRIIGYILAGAWFVWAGLNYDVAYRSRRAAVSPSPSITPEEFLKLYRPKSKAVDPSEVTPVSQRESFEEFLDKQAAESAIADSKASNTTIESVPNLPKQ